MTIINVTQEDIDRGIPHDPTSCPLQRAMDRAIRPGLTVNLTEAMDAYYRFIPWLRAWVEGFDAGLVREPFVLSIDAVSGTSGYSQLSHEKGPGTFTPTRMGG